VQPQAAEHDRARDPGQWLTLLPPANPLFEGGLVGGTGEELGCFLGGGDATGRDEPVDKRLEDGIGD
jgi:hypothetical protein